MTYRLGGGGDVDQKRGGQYILLYMRGGGWNVNILACKSNIRQIRNFQKSEFDTRNVCLYTCVYVRQCSLFVCILVCMFDNVHCLSAY